MRELPMRGGGTKGSVSQVSCGNMVKGRNEEQVEGGERDCVPGSVQSFSFSLYVLTAPTNVC